MRIFTSAWKDLRLAHKLGASFGAIILLASGAFLSQYWQETQIDEPARVEASKSGELARYAATVEKEVQTMCTSLTLYYLTKEKAYEDMKFRADDAAHAAIAASGKLLETLPDSQSMASRLQAVLKTHDDKCEPAELKMLDRMKKGDSAGAKNVLFKEFIPAQEALNASTRSFSQSTVDYLSEREAKTRSLRTMAQGAGWIFKVLALLAAFLLSSGLTRSLVVGIEAIRRNIDSLANKGIPTLRSALERMAEGDLTPQESFSASAAPVEGKDEIAQITSSYNNMLDQLGGASQALAACRKKLSGLISDVASDAERAAESSQTLALTASEGAKSLDHLREDINVMRDMAEESSQGATSLTQASTSLVDAATTSALETNALAENLSKAAASAQNQAALAQQLHATAELGGQAVERCIESLGEIRDNVTATSSSVDELASRQSEIGEIVDTIRSLADQTNLLALNAAIEAARAGDQGRGFAVVADEVRRLAESSSKAAEEIRALISVIQTGLGQVSASMKHSSTAAQLSETVSADAQKSIAQILASIASLDAASVQTAEALTSIEGSAVKLSGVVDMVAATSQETAASSVQLNESAARATAAGQDAADRVDSQVAAADRIAQQASAVSSVAERLKGAVDRFVVAETAIEPFRRAA